MKRMHSLLLVAATFAANTALAHTDLATTVPANGALIGKAPENVQLTFTEPVRLTALSIQKDGDLKQSLGPLPSSTNVEFLVALPATIEDGHYVVTWRALSEDTHVMNGEFMFVVGAEGTHETHMNHENMPAGERHETSAGEHQDEHGGAH